MQKRDSREGTAVRLRQVRHRRPGSRPARPRVELVSSSDTARALRDAGLPVTEVEDVTGVPEMLGHRVVTLHPNIHGGLLADLDNPEHVADLERHGIAPIGLVVSNLYPFVERPDIETIDIGGPAMVRAAAKNHAHVAVVVDPADYDAVLDELRRDGAISPRLAARARPRRRSPTRPAYDAAIVRWLDDGDDGRCPRDAALHARSRRRSCATARTRTRSARATAAAARRAGGTAPCSTAARSCRTSTSSTPTPRGGSCTARRPARGRDRQAREPLRRRRRRRHHRRRTSRATSAIRSRRSAASSR